MLGKNLKAIAALLTAATLIITGCSMTTGTSKKEESDATTTTENTGLSGNVNGLNYACTRENEYGPDLDRGWYIRDAEGERYILICHGMEGGGGHGIHVTDISNDGDTVVISVVDTYDRDMPTDAITHPCCYVEFSKIPEKIKVMVTSENYEMGFGGYIKDTGKWGLDVAIDEDYTAVFVGTGVEHMYIYKNDDGSYRYIDALVYESGEVIVKGSGTAVNIYAVDSKAWRFQAYSYVLVKGDENNQIPVEEYLKMAGA